MVADTVYNCYSKYMTNTLELITAELATKTTDELLVMSETLQGEQDEAGRAVRSCVTEAIINRLDLDALMNTIYYDNLEFEGTTHEAIAQAIAAKA